VLVRLVAVEARPLRGVAEAPVVVLVELQLFALLADTRVAVEAVQIFIMLRAAAVAVLLLLNGKRKNK
jgi:hypothetical protein